MNYSATRQSSAFTVRTCTLTDVLDITMLIQELAQQDGIANQPQQEPLRNLVRVLLTSGSSDFLLAELQDQPVGCLQINYRLSTRMTTLYAHIDDFYIQPAYHHQGLDATLLEYALRQATERGCAYISLDVHAHNKPALGIYQQLGFMPDVNLHLRRYLL